MHAPINLYRGNKVRAAVVSPGDMDAFAQVTNVTAPDLPVPGRKTENEPSRRAPSIRYEGPRARADLEMN